jgi:transketolase
MRHIDISIDAGNRAHRTAQIAFGIRRRVFEHTIRNNGGYLSQACSAADTLAVLYNEILQLGPPTLPPVPRPFPGVPSSGNIAYFTGAGYHGAPAPDCDRLFISPAHYALVIYAALIEMGRMDASALSLFNKDGGSVEMIGAEHSPGMEVTTGSLAQGLSVAAGVAWARKRSGDKGKVWVYMSDGELQEGQTWEAFAACVHHGIDNLRIVMDVNGQQCDGAMESVMSYTEIAARVASFGLTVRDVDGHDQEQLREAMTATPRNVPLFVLARTSPYQGMPALRSRSPRLHYVRFKTAAEREALNERIAESLGIPPVDSGLQAA